MVYLTRRERFNAAHRLYQEEWDERKNLEVFGKCSSPNFHGHNFELFVTVKGPIDPLTGFVINVHELGSIIREYVTEKLDHKNLNLDIDFLDGIIPSTENVAVAIWNQLENQLSTCELHCVKLVETENIYVEYFGLKP